MDGVRVFASDFDGTLNFHDGTPVREVDRAAIEAFRAAGGLFGICTGRSHGALMQEVSGLITLDFVIADTGAAVYDGTGAEIFGRALVPEVAERLWAGFRPRSTWGGVISAAGEYYSVGIRIESWVHTVSRFADVPLPIRGVSFGTDTVAESAQMAVEINRAYDGVAVAHQNLNSVDVVPAGCSKGAGLARVRELMGASLAGAIGDSYNDLPMLEEADWGYTFGDAAEELRTGADVLVGSVAEALSDFTAR